MFAFANTNNIDISSGGCRSTANGIYPLFGKPIITSIQPTRYDEKGRQVHYIESAVQRRERLAFLKNRELDRVATTTSANTTVMHTITPTPPLFHKFMISLDVRSIPDNTIDPLVQSEQADNDFDSIYEHGYIYVPDGKRYVAYTRTVIIPPAPTSPNVSPQCSPRTSIRSQLPNQQSSSLCEIQEEDYRRELCVSGNLVDIFGRGDQP